MSFCLFEQFDFFLEVCHKRVKKTFSRLIRVYRKKKLKTRPAKACSFNLGGEALTQNR
jgi:hypothetical protein